MTEKILQNFIKHLKRYEKIGENLYYQKGYSRSYTEKQVIQHFLLKQNDKNN